ncbi:SPRY domain-containing protein [Azospirillum sp. TSO5]|uniref:SPRY domain-containing protein n=1 Tax=Azospirillum sp. TSO5 TaxID=716760 RepID=UPI000D64948F|nr:SPRY domain-containing protein [Azospirillum sp. TSO5]
MTYPFARRNVAGLMPPRLAQLVETTMIWGGTSTGSANAQVISPEFSADMKGHPTYVWVAGYSNTSAMTLSADGGATTPAHRKADGTAFVGGEIVAGNIYQSVWDGTYWRLIGGSGSGGLFAASLTKATNYTLVPADGGAAVKCTAAIALTLPGTSAVTGAWGVLVSNRSTGSVTIAAAGSDLIAGFASFTLRAGWDVTVYRTGAGAWEVANLATPAAASQATWNPSLAGPSIVLSGGNLTATGGASTSAALATIGASTGKRYCEIYVQSVATANDYRIGLATSATALSGYLGNDTVSWAYVASGGKVTNGTGVAYGAAYTAGDTVGILWDADAGKIWMTKNNVVQGGGDPLAGTNPMYSGISGTLYPAISLVGSGSVGIARFSLTSLVYSPPTGYTTFY